MSDSPSPPKITTISSLTQPHCISTYCTNLFTSIPHLEDEGRSRGLHGQSQQSSRWTPTTAQLLILQELYRQGTKTPTAEQIHQIASQLRRFGKIEGKNVFYWFQNHKARERQKRRRREMEETAASDSAENHKEMLYVMGSSENQEHAGFRGTGYEVKETKKTASTSNCSGLAEEAASLDIAESGPNGWTKFEERGNTLETKAKCQNVDQLRTTTINSTSTVQNSTSQYHNLPFILKRENFSTYYGEENASTRKTLELFPLKRDDQDGMISFNERRSRFCASTSVATQITTSSKFFEFLPLKDRRNI